MYRSQTSFGYGSFTPDQVRFTDRASQHMYNYSTVQSPNYPIQIKATASSGGAVGDAGTGQANYRHRIGFGFGF